LWYVNRIQPRGQFNAAMDRKLSSAPLSAAGPSPWWRKKNIGAVRGGGAVCACVGLCVGGRERDRERNETRTMGPFMQ